MTTAEVLSAALETRNPNLLRRADQLVDWLMAAQKPDGHWTDPNSEDPWDVSSTAWAAWALAGTSKPHARFAAQQAYRWLGETVLPNGGMPANRKVSHPNTYAAAYSLRTLSQAGSDKGGSIRGYLVHSQNLDGGWGLSRGELSESTLTGYVLHGLLDAGDGESKDSLERGLSWLTHNTRANGIWGSWLEQGDSVEGTAFSTYILRRSDRITEEVLLSAMRFLSQHVKAHTAWVIDGAEQVWVAVSCLLASCGVH